MSDPVFRRLYKLLNPSSHGVQEDFLTEIFAELLTESDLVESFFYKLADTRVRPEDISVHTQVTYPKLTRHETDSRPDAVLKFSDNGVQHVAFFENKLGSGEGFQQLERYRDHLKVYERGGSKTYLFYVTQFPDPKEVNHSHFYSLRWYEVLKWLRKAGEENAYAQRVIDYMEEIGLNDSRQFGPLDMYAIQEMNRLQRMMDECMDGPVDGLMNEYFGTPLQPSNRNTQLKYLNRYLKATELLNRVTEVGCGFYVSEDNYPIVSVVFEVNRRCPDRDEVVEVMKEFHQNHPGWDLYDINSREEWAGVSFDKSLVEFLQSDDHITDIQKFFIEKLTELYDVKKAYPNLHWK